MIPGPFQSGLDEGEKALVRMEVLSRVPALAGKPKERPANQDDRKPEWHQLSVQGTGDDAVSSLTGRDLGPRQFRYAGLGQPPSTRVHAGVRHFQDL
jgi:hypothetical protein